MGRMRRRREGQRSGKGIGDAPAVPTQRRGIVASYRAGAERKLWNVSAPRSAGATRLTTCRSRLFPLSPPFHILPLPTFRRRMNLPGNAASMSEPLYFVGVDVGGTTIKGGVMDDTGRALSAVSLATEASKGQAHGL